jgi:flagellar biosynthesis protein FlhG
MNTGTTIIPVAGGKGGVGKTLLAANLAIALAKMGNPTIVADLDLGGSNLHTALGLNNRYPGIGDFFSDTKSNLTDFLVPTQWPLLKFLPGDSQTPFLANLSFSQKFKLVKQLTSLPAKYVLLDIGAGSSYNTLDFFRITANGLLITTPEKPALMNMMSFLKNVQLRSIERAIRKSPDAMKLFMDICSSPEVIRDMNISSIYRKIYRIDSHAAQKIQNIYTRLRPRIIMNMARHPDDLHYLEQVSNALHNRLSLQADNFGLIFDDPNVRNAVTSEQALTEYAPNDISALGISRVAKRIVHMWHQKLENTDRKLHADTCKFYSGMQNAEKPSFGKITRTRSRTILNDLFGSRS